MARRASPTDFSIDVEGIGRFVFARRKMADEIKIQVEYARLIEGVEPTTWLAAVAGWISALSVLTVIAPAGWNIDEMDPTEDETYSRMNAVHKALLQKEGSFRTKPNQDGSATGSGSVQDNGVLVSSEVQPNT